MGSAAHRTAVVTIFVMVFAPVFTHNHWVRQLIGTQKTQATFTCVANQPCKDETITTKVVLPNHPTRAQVKAAEQKAVAKVKKIRKARKVTKVETAVKPR
jgi:hypothetical protein